MNIVVFGEGRRVGLLDGDYVVDVNNAVAAYLSATMHPNDARWLADARAPSELVKFIVGGKESLALAQAGASHVKGSNDGSLVQPLGSVRLRAPWPGRRVFANGANYAEHSARARSNAGKTVTVEEVEKQAREFGAPGGFTKVSHEVMGHEDPITYPSRTERFDYEGELAVILGVAGKNIPADRAIEHIYGVSLANDWSIRDDRLHYLQSTSFNLQKNFDCSVSLGPCINVSGLDTQNIDISLEVNGEQRQNYSTRSMIFSVAETLSYLSRDFTLLPGDVLICGTGPGTAVDSSKRDAAGKLPPERFLKLGDVVEVKSPQIGCLRNRIVAG